MTGPAGNDHAGRDPAGIAGLFDDVGDRIEDLAQTGLDDARQQHQVHLEIDVVVLVPEHQLAVLDGVLLAAPPLQDLDVLGPLTGDTGVRFNIASDRLPGKGNNRHVPYDVVLDDGHFRRALADVDQGHAVFHLPGREHSPGRCNRGKDGLVEPEAALFQHLQPTVKNRLPATEQDELRLHLRTEHTDQFVLDDADPVFRVETLRDGLEDRFILSHGSAVLRPD